MFTSTYAPGWPGIAARWTSSMKDGIGVAYLGVSPVWFTLSHGIMNEIYYPRMDQAMIRDMELIITNAKDFFSEEKRNTRHHVELINPGVPAYKLKNECISGHFGIEKIVVSDPHRPVVLNKVKFVTNIGSISDYHIYVLLAPHIVNRGAGNTAWVGDYKGHQLLMASRDGYALALVASVPFNGASAGFVGASDGWQDLKSNKKLTNFYQRAENGNVALVGELDAVSSDGEFVLALGFGRTPEEAAHQALASLYNGFDDSLKGYVGFWTDWHGRLIRPKKSAILYDISAAVLKVHTGVYLPGGIIASLSIPWGSSKGDDDLGGYHLIWPRDMVEAASALVAIGAYEETRQALTYLEATQEGDGHWPQNMWSDGSAYWHGIQIDETSLPILLVDLAYRNGAISDDDLKRFWPMMKNAVAFVVRSGPVSQQDRWEEDPGYTPFTLAAEIASLVVAADYAERFGETDVAKYLLETADIWNSNIERWIYVSNTTLSNELNIDGYYVRIAPVDLDELDLPTSEYVEIRNRPEDKSKVKVTHIISPDVLALVRFGLRSGNDPRIRNTLKVIDKHLRVDTPTGPSWHRYNGDGYGEHEDGSPFDGTGIGRAWPLLTGERAHYEIASGRTDEAEKLLKAMESFAGEGGLIPEQIWDSPDIPEKELFFGRPSGSAMPLVWAHAEYIKLVRSIEDKTVFDMPPQTVKRFINESHPAVFASWRFNHKIRVMPKGMRLRIEVLAPAIVHWSSDGWERINDTPTHDVILGIHVADLDTSKLGIGSKVLFTFYWKDSNTWEGSDFSIEIE